MQYINSGLRVCDSFEPREFSVLYWPGTSAQLKECQPQNVKVWEREYEYGSIRFCVV